LVAVFYQTESNSQDSLVLAINETVKASAMDNLNDVVRVKEGTSQLNISAFEKDTKERLATEIGSKRKAKSVTF
ncbi:hypothetical protein, partial [Enterococcus sp. C76]|uniref:hypothetical protein n=1 Tax=Enterococcus sp. C76 TaxID=3231334 RepID=UPI0034A080CF